MRYTAPEYKNEAIEAKDVITVSIVTEVDEVTGEEKVVVTGYLSNLLGNM